jgi:hypothetical protein
MVGEVCCNHEANAHIIGDLLVALIAATSGGCGGHIQFITGYGSTTLPLRPSSKIKLTVRTVLTTRLRTYNVRTYDVRTVQLV